MTWTYDPTDLSTSRAQVRFRCGDTNTNEQLLTDEEIAYILSVQDAILLAAAQACDAIWAKLSRETDRSNLGMSSSRSQQVQHYKDLAKQLRDEHKATEGDRAPVVGGTFTGISKNERDSLRQDTDYIRPRAETDLWDNPGINHDDRDDCGH